MVDNNSISIEKKEKRKLRETAIGSVILFTSSFFFLFYIFGNILIYDTTLQNITIYISNYILNVLGVETVVEGLTIYSNDLKAHINIDCTCFTEIVLFFSILIAFPISCKFKKINIALMSIPILFGMSIVRIVSIIVVNKFYGIYYFDLFHCYIWTITVILFPTILLYIFCKQKV